MHRYISERASGRNKIIRDITMGDLIKHSCTLVERTAGARELFKFLLSGERSARTPFASFITLPEGHLNSFIIILKQATTAKIWKFFTQYIQTNMIYACNFFFRYVNYIKYLLKFI